MSGIKTGFAGDGLIATTVSRVARAKPIGIADGTLRRTRTISETRKRRVAISVPSGCRITAAVSMPSATTSRISVCRTAARQFRSTTGRSTAGIGILPSALSNTRNA